MRRIDPLSTRRDTWQLLELDCNDSYTLLAKRLAGGFIASIALLNDRRRRKWLLVPNDDLQLLGLWRDDLTINISKESTVAQRATGLTK